MKLLVTERDPLVRKWLGARAEELGVQLVFATTSLELRAAIDGPDTPDCVVMDASTSVREHGPLWSRLREISDMPILVYSSSRRWQTVAEQAGETVDGFLPLPFTPDVMINAAKHAASRRSARGVSDECQHSPPWMPDLRSGPPAQQQRQQHQAH